MLKKIGYWAKKLFIWAFEARLIHYAMHEAQKLVMKKLDGSYTEEDIKKFGKSLIKKVASQPIGKCISSCNMITKSSCDGLLDNIKLEIDPYKQEIKFNVDGRDLLRFDFIRRIFK